jgi:hypothetical protein
MSKKKQTIVRDELNHKGGGIYCYLPFEKLDIHKKAVFKVGLAINFNKRVENYHTYFPLGVYMIAFLDEPPIPITLRNKSITSKKSHYLKIEKFIINHIVKNGGVIIHSTTRVNNPNDDKEGATEWIYTNEETIHNAFLDAKKKFSGLLDLYSLGNINKIGNENEKNKPNYVGKIIFPL